MSTLVATGLNAVVALGPQLIALVLLVPVDFARFSLVYLIFALGTSVLLSTVCEATNHQGEESGRDITAVYLSAAGWIAATTLPVSLTVALTAGTRPLDSVILAVAIALACYRVPARFREVATHQVGVAARADLVGALALFAVVTGGLLLDAPGLTTIALAWCVAGAASTAVGFVVRPAGPSVLVEWIRPRRARVKHLLSDSVLLDISSIGTPYAIAPLLGLAGFSAYRAVSNVAAPVRILLSAVRPWIATSSARVNVRGRHMVLALTLSVSLGGAAFGALAILDSSGLDVGALSEVSRFAVQCGLFVAAGLMGQYLYVAARSHLSGTALWRGRLLQSVLAIGLPVAGALSRDTEIAINYYVASAILCAFAWYLFLLPVSRREAGSGGPSTA